MNKYVTKEKIRLLNATIDDYPCIQNMSILYIYDLSRKCGSISSEWAMPKNGLYKSLDLKKYFKEPSRKAYLVKVYDEIAGFILLNQATEDPANTWNIGEFFIIAKFQGQGIASYLAGKIWDMHPSKWEVSVIPENKSALIFWEITIGEYTYGDFSKQIKKVTYDEHQPKRIIFEFDTENISSKNIAPQIIIRPSECSDIETLVSLSKVKRLKYEKAQPQFWRSAGEEGDNCQRRWFRELLKAKDYLMFTAIDKNQEILGFIIGRLVSAPEVYDPEGLTLMIDDFCVKSENLWETVGKDLIWAIKELAKDKGATQILVVCGAHDYVKRKFLSSQNLSIASEWFVGSML